MTREISGVGAIRSSARRTGRKSVRKAEQTCPVRRATARARTLPEGPAGRRVDYAGADHAPAGLEFRSPPRHSDPRAESRMIGIEEFVERLCSFGGSEGRRPLPRRRRDREILIK